MTRVKYSVKKRQRHKKVLKLCKGYFGRSKSCFKIANRLLKRSYNYQFYDRKKNKSNKRREFISIINAFCRSIGFKYSEFICKLNLSKYKNILDRKSFAILIQNDIKSAHNLFKLIMI
ncbi:50S ribosomal protein L20 [uncultured bacterium]|uniref:Putative 50S ribosomal protein L20 n=1 Tax=uncultured microorganism TaxID=358574 RepID=A0A077JNI2_9ZZZZ|nr:putative 50S ribosomal protein L20 [uncultured microorganism]BCL65665.1 50S ribosomal protein L20 [uncultured bacterium]